MDESVEQPKNGESVSDRPISSVAPAALEDKPPALERRIDQLERFRGLLDHSHDMILLIHLASRRIVDANVSACRQLCYSPDDLRSMSVGEIVAMNRLRWFDAAGDPTAAGRVTTVLLRKGEIEIPVEISFSMDNFDGSAYVVTVARDISSRIKSELVLKQHQILLNSVLNHTDNAILALDSDLRVIYYNDQYLKLYPFGRPYMDSRPTVDALIRRACEIGLYPPDEAEELIARRLEQLGRVAEHMVIETPRLDGVMIEAFASWLPSGGYLLTFRDITERNRAEEALRESEERFRSIFETGAAGMATFSPAGRFLQANPAFCRFIGYTEAELLRLSIEDVTHPEALEETRRSYGEIMAGQRQVIDYEKRYIRKDGAVVWGHATVACVLDAASKPSYCVGLLQDITARKKAEEVLRESDRMKTEFITTAAHELRTPLTSIQGFSQVLLTQPDISPAEQKEFLSYIHERAAALSRTMDDLLDVARIESGQKLLLNRAVCTAGELFRQAAPMMQTIVSAHRFEQDVRDEDARLDVDKGKVGQVLENLLTNAMKYSPSGSLIRVEGESVNATYRLAVIDQGIGMTAEQADRMFDKFYRVDASNTALEGIGLGMSIVKNIVEAHGGRIWVKSAPASGTAVYFTLPLADGAPK